MLLRTLVTVATPVLILAATTAGATHVGHRIAAPRAPGYRVVWITIALLLHDVRQGRAPDNLGLRQHRFGTDREVASAPQQTQTRGGGEVT